MIAPIHLTKTSQLFNTPMVIAGIHLQASVINDAVYLSSAQGMLLVGMEHGSTFYKHVDAILGKMGLGREAANYTPSAWIHEVTVLTPPTNLAGTGMGTRVVKFYHLRLVLEAGMCTRNAQRKAALLKWLIATNPLCIGQHPIN